MTFGGRGARRAFLLRAAVRAAAVGFTLLLCCIAGPTAAQAEVRPQFGLELYGGTNKLLVVNPWLGLRFGLSRKTSLIFRYHYHSFSFDYWGQGGSPGETVLKKRQASVSRFSGTFYFQSAELEGYSSLSYLTGTDGYRGYVTDNGLEWKFVHAMSALVSLYTIRERSVLWRPEEEPRWLNTYSLRLGAKFRPVRKLAFNPNVYFHRNSEDVKGTAWSAGLVYTPSWWLAVTAYYFRYGETAFYTFRGNYFNFGLNFYF